VLIQKEPFLDSRYQHSAISSQQKPKITTEEAECWTLTAKCPIQKTSFLDDLIFHLPRKGAFTH